MSEPDFAALTGRIEKLENEARAQRAGRHLSDADLRDAEMRSFVASLFAADDPEQSASA